MFIYAKPHFIVLIIFPSFWLLFDLILLLRVHQEEAVVHLVHPSCLVLKVSCDQDCSLSCLVTLKERLYSTYGSPGRNKSLEPCRGSQYQLYMASAVEEYALC